MKTFNRCLTNIVAFSVMVGAPMGGLADQPVPGTFTTMEEVPAPVPAVQPGRGGGLLVSAGNGVRLAPGPRTG